MGLEEFDRLGRFLFDGLHASAAIGVDVCEVKFFRSRRLDRLAHAEKVRTRRRAPRMPGDVGAAFVGDADEFAARLEGKRPVPAHDLDAHGARRKRFLDEYAEFVARRLVGSETSLGIEPFQNRRMNAAACLQRMAQDVRHRSGHVEAGRHARERRHAHAVGRPEGAAEVQMRVDEPRAHHETRAVGFLGCVSLVMRGDGRDPSVFDHHVRDAVKAVFRVDDPAAAQNTIRHVCSPSFQQDVGVPETLVPGGSPTSIPRKRAGQNEEKAEFRRGNLDLFAGRLPGVAARRSGRPP